MEEEFPEAIRVEAVDGQDIDYLMSMLPVPDESFVTSVKSAEGKQRENLLKSQFSVGHLGELACFASHIKAIKQAYEWDHELVIIGEDDLSNKLCGLWLAPLADYIEQLEAIDPHWDGLRLAWGGLREDVAALKFKHIESVKSIKGPITNVSAEVPLVTADTPKQFWGTGAVLYKKSGLKKILDYNIRADGKLACEASHICVADDEMWPPEMNMYLTSPPILTVRIDENSAIRGAKVDNAEFMSRNNMEAIRWTKILWDHLQRKKKLEI